jgi:hypothetical protein
MGARHFDLGEWAKGELHALGDVALKLLQERRREEAMLGGVEDDLDLIGRLEIGIEGSAGWST